MKKTLKELEDLKESWVKDPCWDIYDTEGFEYYTAELKLFQRVHERKKEIEAEKRDNKLKALLYSLPLNKALGLPHAPTTVLRVPGGWVYTNFTDDGSNLSSCFVPFSNEFQTRNDNAELERITDNHSKTVTDFIAFLDDETGYQVPDRVFEKFYNA